MSEVLVTVGGKSWLIPNYDAQDLLDALELSGREVDPEEVAGRGCNGCGKREGQGEQEGE